MRSARLMIACFFILASARAQDTKDGVTFYGSDVSDPLPDQAISVKDVTAKIRELDEREVDNLWREKSDKAYKQADQQLDALKGLFPQLKATTSISAEETAKIIKKARKLGWETVESRKKADKFRLVNGPHSIELSTKTGAPIVTSVTLKPIKGEPVSLRYFVGKEGVQKDRSTTSLRIQTNGSTRLERTNNSWRSSVLHMGANRRAFTYPSKSAATLKL